MRVGIDLSTRVAIVTGAGGGLGAAHAIALAKRGAKLVVADMNGEAAASVAAQIEAAGGEAMPAAVSVTDFAAVQAMGEAALGATAMTNNLYSEDMLAGLGASLVSPAVVALAAEDAPSRAILLAGAGSFEQAHVTMTRGLFLGDGETVADTLLDRLAEIGGRDQDTVPARGEAQYQYEMAARAEKVNA